MIKATFPDNFRAIDPVVAEIRHSKVCRLHICASTVQISFSRPNEATVELFEGCRRFFVTFGTFYNCFCGRKTPNSRDYASNCPYPVANVSRQSNSLIYLKTSYRKNTGPFSSIFRPYIEEISGHILSKNGGDSIWIAVARSNTKLIF